MCGASLTYGQGAAPDCVINFTFTGAANSSVLDNRSKYCESWAVAYNSTGFTGSLALTLQAAPASTTNGVPGTWGTFGGTTVSGSNPLTAVTYSSGRFTGYAAYLRVNLASLTGSGTVTGRLYGWRYVASKVSESSSGGGGGSGDVVGPASSTNNAIALYDGTTGKLLKGSTTLLPTGALAGVGQANTYTTGLQNFSSATLILPIGGFFAPVATGEIGWNANIKRLVVGDLTASAKTLAVQGTASPTANDCVKFDADGLLVTAGAPCASGGTTVSAASPYVTVGGSLFGPIYTVTNPSSPSWAWVNQNNATLTTTNNAQTLCALGTGGSVSVNMRMVSTPATPWTVTAMVVMDVTNASLPRVGLAMRESGTGKIITTGAASMTEFYTENWSSATAFANTAITTTVGASAGFKFMRMSDNGTNVKLSYSYDGIGWIDYYDFSRTNYFTTAPNQFGFFVMNNSGTTTLNACTTLLSWLVT